MKIPLSEQIEEAERVRDALQRAKDEGVTFTSGPTLETRLDRQEAICVTLEWLAVYRDDFLEYMKHRKEPTQ